MGVAQQGHIVEMLQSENLMPIEKFRTANWEKSYAEQLGHLITGPVTIAVAYPCIDPVADQISKAVLKSEVQILLARIHTEPHQPREQPPTGESLLDGQDQGIRRLGASGILHRTF